MAAPSVPPLLHLVLLVLPPLLSQCGAAEDQAEQIHLAYTEDVTKVQVTYSTFQEVSAAAKYGKDVPSALAEGFSTPFAQGEGGAHLQYIHRVTMDGLEPGEQYVYQVYGPSGWSEQFRFRAMPSGTGWSPRLLVYGDLGTENGKSLPFLLEEARTDTYDAVLHVGDFAYDMHDQDGETGDTFMRQIQPVAAHLPYMVCPGNHEQYGNFSNYRNRFSMPGGTESMYYSFNMGPIHFISLSTEFYYFLSYGINQTIAQYNWLKADLEAASAPAARAERPWIVLFGHRPMYCTNRNTDDCTSVYDKVRVGSLDTDPPLPGLEDLMMEHGVDIAIWGHEHSYERMWPLYNFTVYNGTAEEPYRNPGAPVHIVTGSAGCKEELNPFKPERRPWTAFRSLEYGYSRFSFHNGSHMSVEQVAITSDGNSSVVDSVTIIKEVHRTYSEFVRTEEGYL